MFEALTHFQLQQYWWFLISVIAALFVFMTFVQGGQSLIFTLGKDEKQKSLIINALGRKWELTFTSLVLFGGAFFASFPLFYSTSFSGTYWLWMIILFSMVIQAVSYEYRSKPNNFLGKRTFDIFLYLNGLIGLVFLGIVVGSMFTGANFLVNEFHFSIYQNGYRGLELILHPFNLLFGFMLFFLARTQAMLYFLNNIDNEELRINTRRTLLYNALVFVVLYLIVAAMIVTMQGYAYNAAGHVTMESYKYLHNLLALPLLGLIPLLAGTLLVLYALFIALVKKSRNGIWFSGLGTVLVVIALFSILGYNGTSFYPSSAVLQSSLTIQNASSSHYTLTVMSYVSLFVPFVLAYVILTWRAMNKPSLTEEEINNDPHSY